MTMRVGVDFGTANTVIARWDEAAGRGEPVPLPGLDLVRDGAAGVTQRVVPSLIAFSRHGEQRWTGARVTADPRLLADSTVTVFQSMKTHVTGRAVDIPRTVGDQKITSRMAAAQFLADVTAAVILAVDSADLELVATAPVEAFDAYRDWLTGEVSLGAGAARLRLVDEATAAAVGYQARMSPGDVFCVFDFGAGTLDISVTRVMEPEAAGRGPAVRVLAKAGLDLGGQHIDGLLAEWAASRAQLPQADAAARGRMFRQLLAGAERAKIELGRAGQAVIAAADPVTGAEVSVPVTRAEFDSLLREKDILGRAGRGLRKALDDAAGRGYPAADISAVFLTGGSSMIAAVRDMVALQFDPAIIHLDRPLEAVAAGAAAIAGGQELYDHIQHDYAIRYVGADGDYEFRTLVPAGTRYPAADPVTSLTIQPVHQQQHRLGIAIYELAHATYRDAGAELEIIYDADGGARTEVVGVQDRQEQAMRWLNEDSPTFLRADPPAATGTDRFRLDFRIDTRKCLTVSAFDLERKTWVLDRQPVVRLA